MKSSRSMEGSEVFQLTNTQTPMDGITNISNIVSANQDEEVWVELQYYRDRKHLEEVTAKFRNDENMYDSINSLWIYLVLDPASSWESSTASSSRYQNANNSLF
jgi:hypothetical protein